MFMPEEPNELGAKLLISDADRERVLEQLRVNTAEGRLTLEEFSDRASALLAARTRSELTPLTADLPAAPASLSTGGRQGTRWTVAVMGAATRRGRWRVDRHTNVVALMGGCTIDLRGAELEGPEIVVNAVAVMGGVDVVVPPGIQVELSGLPIMGGKDLRTHDSPRIPGSPVVRVRAFALMGGVSVRTKPGKPPISSASG